MKGIGTKAMVKTRSTEHRTTRRDTKGKQEATKGKREATTAGNLGGNRTESGIVRGHKWRTIGERKHRVHTQANTLSGNKTRLALRSLGAWRQGYLDRRNVDEGGVGENNGGRRVAEAMAMRHEFEGLDWAQG